MYIGTIYLLQSRYHPMHQGLIVARAPRGDIEQWIEEYRNEETELSMEGFVTWINEHYNVDASVIEPEPVLF